LRELEQIADEFLTVAALVIQRCRERDPRVLSHVHVDFTEDESHASLVHDCRPGEDCSYKKATKGGKWRWGCAKRPERVAAQVARAERHALAGDDPETAAEREKKITPEKSEKSPERVRVNGCWVSDAGSIRWCSRIYRPTTKFSLLGGLLRWEGH
jgi:hypothetical protein